MEYPYLVFRNSFLLLEFKLQPSLVYPNTSSTRQDSSLSDPVYSHSSTPNWLRVCDRICFLPLRERSLMLRRFPVWKCIYAVWFHMKRPNWVHHPVRENHVTHRGTSSGELILIPNSSFFWRYVGQRSLLRIPEKPSTRWDLNSRPSAWSCKIAVLFLLQLLRPLLHNLCILPYEIYVMHVYTIKALLPSFLFYVFRRRPLISKL